jgi:hypothetical protein
MSTRLQNKRPQWPSILTVFRPVEEYWSHSGLARSFGPDPERLLNPFDALLMHLVLDFTPDRPVLVDLAAGATGGASSVVGLTHPHVRRVVTVAGAAGDPANSDRVVSALQEFGRGSPSGLAHLDVLPADELPGLLPDLCQAVILVDLRGEGTAGRAEAIRRWLDEQPDALVLLLGLGRVGECPAVESAIRLCSADSGRRLWLLRELGEVLAASGLGMVAMRDHPHVAEILLRIQNLYTGNYRFLELFKAVNLAEIRAAEIDLEVLRSHPSSRSEMPESFRASLRRKLAPGVVGKSWRFSKRVIRKGTALIR